VTEHNHQANHRPPYRLRIDEVTSRSEALPSRSHSGRRVVIAACLALILVWGLLQVGFRLWRSGYQARATYGATEVAPIIDSLADVIPPATNPDAWRQAVAETHAMLVTLTAANLLNITVGPAAQSVGHFQDELQGPFGTLRLHGAGHYAMGGDGSDVFTSLNDPAFYLHHAMVDRVYWIWQVLHPAKANTVNGTITFRNNPPSRNGTVNDWLEMGALGPSKQIKDVLNTMGGSPLCYIYL